MKTILTDIILILCLAFIIWTCLIGVMITTILHQVIIVPITIGIVLFEVIAMVELGNKLTED